MARTIHMLSAVVESRISGFLSGVERAKSATRDLRMAVGDFVNSVNSAGTRIAAGLTAMTAGLTKQAFNFQDAMVPIRSILSKMPDEEFKKFERGLRDLSKEFGRSNAEIAEGVFNLLSAGASANEVFDVMRKISPLVISGQTDMATATRIAANAVNAYGRKWSEVDKITDAVFRANDDGIGSLAQWAKQIPAMTNFAAKLNISFQDMIGHYASITKGTKSAENAAVGYSETLMALTRESKELDVIFQRAGFRNAQEAIKATSLTNALEILTTAVGGSVTELSKYLGSKEAVNAVLALTGQNAERTARFVKNANNAMGESQKRLDQTNKLGVERFRKSWTAILDTILTIAAPVSEEVVKLAQGFQEFFNANESEVVEKTTTALKQFLGIGQSVITFFQENKGSIKEAADEVGKWLGWLLRFAAENPRIVAALVLLKVAGFLGLTGVAKAFFNLLMTTGSASFRAFLWGLGKLRAESKTTADSVAADAAKQATAREAASAKTIGALLAERNAQIAAQSASAGATATVVGSATVAAGAGSTAASAASAGILHRQLALLGTMSLAVDTAIKRLSTTVMIFTGATRVGTAGLLGFNRQLLLTGTVANFATTSVRRIGTTAFTFGAVGRGAAAATGAMRRLTVQTVATGTAATTAGGKWAGFFSMLATRVDGFKTKLSSLGPMAMKGGVIAALGLAFVGVTSEIGKAKKAVEELENSINQLSRLEGFGHKQRDNILEDAKTNEERSAVLKREIEGLRVQERGASQNAAKERKNLNVQNATDESQGFFEKVSLTIRRAFSFAVGTEAAMAATAKQSEQRAAGLRDRLADKERELQKLQDAIAGGPREPLMTNRAGATGPLDPGFRDSDYKKEFQKRLDGFAFDPNKDKGAAEADTKIFAEKRDAFDSTHPGADKLRELLMLGTGKDAVNITVDQVSELGKTLKLTDGALLELTSRFQELKGANLKPADFLHSMEKLVEDTFTLDASSKKADEQAKVDFDKLQQSKKDQQAAHDDVGQFFKDIRSRAVAALEDLPEHAAAAGLRDKAEFFVEEFQAKALALEQSLANGSLSVDGFNRAMTDLRSEADQTAAALQREIDAEKRRRLLRGDFSLLDPRKALEDRILSFRMQQFNQGIDSVFRRMFPFADQLGKTTDSFVNLNNGIQNFGNTLQNFGSIGAEKVSESWNQITSWMNSRAGQIASVEAQIQLLLQNLGLMGNNSFNYKGMQIRKQLDSLYDILDALMAQAPPTFLDMTGNGIFNDPGLQTTQQPQTNNISLSFPNLDKLTNADARQILQVVNLELQRAGHQRVF